MSKPNWKPGSKPLTTKPDLYVQLMSQGLNNSEASRQAGVNRKTGQRWRLGRVVKDTKHGEYRYDPIVPPAPLGPGSGRYLSGDERLVIADGIRAGRSRRAIAGELNRSVSTVCREVLRNAEPSGDYRPHAAHQRMLTRRSRPMTGLAQLNPMPNRLGHHERLTGVHRNPTITIRLLQDHIDPTRNHSASKRIATRSSRRGLW